MKLTLETATKYAEAADAMYERLYRKLCELKGEMICGPSGSIGYRNVGAVLRHMQERERQINAVLAEIAELESTDSDSEQVLELADRLGLSI